MLADIFAFIELVIKTTHLLLKLEESLKEEANHSGKMAIIYRYSPPR